MYLSPSEVFWVSIVYSQLDAIASSRNSRASRPYACISALAKEYGVGHEAIVEYPLALKPPVVPGDIRWAVNGELVSEDDAISETCARIAHSTNQARATVSDSDERDHAVKRLEAYTQALINGYVCGFAASTPSVLYGINVDGEVITSCRVKPHSRGLYLSVLRLLGPYLDLPACEHMALAKDAEASASALTKWTPSNLDLTQHGDMWYPENCLGLLMQECIISDEDETFVCAQLLFTAQDAMHAIASEAAAIEEGEGGVPSVVPDKGVEQGRSSLFEILDKLPVVLQQPVDHGGQEGEDVVGGERLNVVEFGIKHALSYCERIGLASPADVLSHTLHAVRELRCAEVPALNDGMRRSRLLLVGRECKRLAATIDDAKKLIYGELRYRDSCDEATRISGAAQAGLPAQHVNVREVLRHAVEQLNDDSRAYPTLATLSPAVEPVVRGLASRHLRHLNAYRTSDIIHELRDAANRRGDQNLVFLCSVAHAANALRNRVMHEPEQPYDRHHANFLFNAIALMLREI